MFFFEVIPGVLGRLVNYNIAKISIKTARASRLSVSYDYVVTQLFISGLFVESPDLNICVLNV